MSQSLTPINRRQLLKILAAAAGAAALSTLPTNWKTPVVEVGALPAHAQTSLHNVIICLSGDTRIDTPMGAVRVTDITVGTSVWTLDATGLRIPAAVVKTARNPVPANASIIHLALSDGRAVMVSAGHPTTDGRTIGDLGIGDMLDGARVVKADSIRYDQPAKYDLLPAGETGSYWANGIPMHSTIEMMIKRRVPALA